MLSIDNKQNVYLNGQPVQLTNLEHLLLVFFMVNRIGINLSRNDIIDHVWGVEQGQYVSPATLEKLVARLRNKLKALTGIFSCPFIKAGRTNHYMMVWPDEWEAPEETIVARDDEAQLLAMYRQLSDEQKRVFLATASGLLKMI